MSTNSIAPPPEEAIGVSPTTSPLIRPMSFPIAQGRLWTARLDSEGKPWQVGELRVCVSVTPYGHWYRTDDPAVSGPMFGPGYECRGCGMTVASFPCPNPASAQDVATALLADFPRPRPTYPASASTLEFYRRIRREALEAAL